MNKSPCYPGHNLDMPEYGQEIIVCPEANILIKGVAQVYAALYDGVISKQHCYNHDGSEKIINLDFNQQVG